MPSVYPVIQAIIPLLLLGRGGGLLTEHTRTVSLCRRLSARSLLFRPIALLDAFPFL